MKYFTFLVFVLFLFTSALTSYGQQEIVVKEIVGYMSQGERTGFEVALVDAEPKDVTTSWSKFMKKYKAKVVTSKKSVEIFADNASIPQVSSNTVDVYAITRKTDYGTSLSVYVDLGGSYISSRDHEIAYGAFSNILKEFGLSEAVRVVEEELGAQQDVYKDLGKELEVLLKDKDKYLKEIEEAKALIAQRETDIRNNEMAQETKRQQIAIQEEIVKTIQQKRDKLNYK